MYFVLSHVCSYILIALMIVYSIIFKFIFFSYFHLIVDIKTEFYFTHISEKGPHMNQFDCLEILHPSVSITSFTFLCL